MGHLLLGLEFALVQPTLQGLDDLRAFLADHAGDWAVEVVLKIGYSRAVRAVLLDPLTSHQLAMIDRRLQSSLNGDDEIADRLRNDAVDRRLHHSLPGLDRLGAEVAVDDQALGLAGGGGVWGRGGNFVDELVPVKAREAHDVLAVAVLPQKTASIIVGVGVTFENVERSIAVDLLDGPSVVDSVGVLDAASPVVVDLVASHHALGTPMPGTSIDALLSVASGPWCEGPALLDLLGATGPLAPGVGHLTPGTFADLFDVVVVPLDDEVVVRVGRRLASAESSSEAVENGRDRLSLGRHVRHPSLHRGNPRRRRTDRDPARRRPPE